MLDTGAATADSKDWEEFEYIINRASPSASTLTVARSTGGWNWEKTGDASYTVSGNVMQLSVPRSALGLTDTSKALSFGFKWCDNNLTDGDIMTVYTEGDAAPGGRFTFAFNSDASAAVDPGSDPGDNNSTSSPGGSGNSSGSANNPLSIVLCVLAVDAALAAVAAAVVIATKKKK